jgi:hypothetical protein
VVLFVTSLLAFCYGSSCISLRSFVHSITTLHAFGRPSCQLALYCIWVPLLPTHLALALVAQPWPSSSCVSLRLFVCLGAHVAKSPCIAFGHPSCELALPYVRVPNLGETVLKTLPPSQNCFLSILRLVFLPSAPFVWSFSLRLFVRFIMAIREFCYGSSRVLLWPFMRFVKALRVFGRPSRQLALHCI